MAIYHLSANVISRARGQSVVAAAAYRAGVRLRDERYGEIHDYTARRAVVHAEILAPVATPDWVHDREVLWNRVEAAELRKDSQLARVIELGLPVELTGDETLALVRDFTVETLVVKGMIADLSIRRDNPHNPLAQLLLTLREVGASGFGPKARRWNGKASLLEWRASWAARANEHLARAGHAVRIDHRTLEAQQIELTPTRRVGIGPRATDKELPAHLADRVVEQQRIARDNGAAILEDPAVALRALAHRSPVFSAADIAQFLTSRTDADQYAAAYQAVLDSAELVALQPAADATARYTSRDMIDATKSLMQRAHAMALRRGHGVSSHAFQEASPALPFAAEPRRAFEYLVGEGDAKAVVLEPGLPGESVLAAARRAWETDGLRVAGVTPSVAPDATGVESTLPSTLLERCEAEWQQGLGLPTRATVLVVFRAEMIALKALERLLAIADRARAKVVLVSDALRLESIRTELPFSDVLRAIGSSTAFG